MQYPWCSGWAQLIESSMPGYCWILLESKTERNETYMRKNEERLKMCIPFSMHFNFRLSFLHHTRCCLCCSALYAVFHTDTVCSRLFIFLLPSSFRWIIWCEKTATTHTHTHPVNTIEWWRREAKNERERKKNTRQPKPNVIPNYIIFLTSNLFSTMKWNERVALMLTLTQPHTHTYARTHTHKCSKPPTIRLSSFQRRLLFLPRCALSHLDRTQKIISEYSQRDDKRHIHTHRAGTVSPNETNKRNRKHELNIKWNEKKTQIFFPVQKMKKERMNERTDKRIRWRRRKKN